ncbi:DsbA family protein [Haliangium sp.]|uniref:DsbA family protein n=1 Tax=Haliangium sp. TaxID=2663208 RepID=UPI003D0B7304
MKTPSHVACAAVFAALLLSSGCAGRQDIDQLTVRVENLEQRERRVTQMEEQLGQIEARTERLLALTEMVAGRVAAIEDMAAKLAAIEDQLGPRPRPRRRRPDPTLTYAVPIDGSPFEGRADAKVTIVKGFEFACPFCERSRATIEQIRRHYGDDVRIVYKHYIVHPQIATIPAQAACAADAQGAFSAMKDAIWEYGYKAGRNLGRDNMVRIARRLKLDMRRFRSALDGPCVERVQRDQALLSTLGVTGTPAFFINGRFLSGAQPFPAFQTLIDEELAKANEAIGTQGIAPGDYYEHVVTNGRNKL